jgi:membrane protease YdiL (CAAX protease family)
MIDDSTQPSTNNLIAPLSHTGLLLLIILCLTLLGFYSQKNSLTAASPEAQSGKIFLYLSVIALQYGLLRLIIGGLRRKGISLGAIIGRKENDLRSLGFDFIFAGIFLVICRGILELIKMWFGGVDNHAGGLLPNGVLESLLWIVVSIAAGFVEEVCYRGYLQKQIQALTGSVTIAILLQAVLFGISHSYQGIKSVIVIFAYGVMFGLLAFWRDSLRPGIIAHALTDIIGGLIR